jgi:hypothetical protein
LWKIETRCTTKLEWRDAYLKVLALLVSREHKLEHSNVIKSLSDQELEATAASPALSSAQLS